MGPVWTLHPAEVNVAEKVITVNIVIGENI